jgi:hypothetical protein
LEKYGMVDDQVPKDTALVERHVRIRAQALR